jgi:hypothetical protein
VEDEPFLLESGEERAQDMVQATRLDGVVAASLATEDPHPGVQVVGHRRRERVDPGRDEALVVPVAAFCIQVASMTLLNRASTCSDPAHTLRQELSEPVRAPVAKAAGVSAASRAAVRRRCSATKSSPAVRHTTSSPFILGLDLAAAMTSASAVKTCP